MKLILGLVFAIGLISCIHSLDNGLALTPPMGWMTWERFRCIIDCDRYPTECISDSLIRRTADRMVEDGYLEAGYQYLVIDDCWLEKERSPQGDLVPDRIRFPHGMRNLSDYVHSKGLKFGIYQDYGTKTCGGYPGLQGYIERDINQFVDWKVDYVKIDGCYHNLFTYPQDYEYLSKVLNESGRSIVYSCSYPAYAVDSSILFNFEQLAKNCNLWRIYDDIDDSWESVQSIISYFASQQITMTQYAGPGQWNDPDMLIIGNYGLSYEQSKTQMAIWAILAAPLFMSTDLDTIRPEYRDILLNKKVIAINQDPLGAQGLRIYQENKKFEIWKKPVTPVVNGENSYALAIRSIRYDGHAVEYNITLSNLGFKNNYGYEVEDLFDDNLRYVYSPGAKNLTVRVNPSGVRLFKLTPLTEHPVVLGENKTPIGRK